MAAALGLANDQGATSASPTLRGLPFRSRTSYSGAWGEAGAVVCSGCRGTQGLGVGADTAFAAPSV